MNGRLSSGQLQSEKAVDWLYFLYLCVYVHIIISVQGVLKLCSLYGYRAALISF